MTYSAYLQDEWKLFPGFTVNFGGRFDRYDGFRSEQQFSPRVNAVWTPTKTTTIHAGYARYFSPAPFANVATTSVAKFVGTSAEAPGLTSTAPFAERQDYFDVGVEQKIGPSLTIGIDGYHRRSKNLIDEGQFGAPIILTPFNYRDGRIDGIEGSISYARGPVLVYANFAYAKAQGRDIISSEFSFDPGDLAYIQNHFIYLDHDQTYTGSAGASYRFGGQPGWREHDLWLGAAPRRRGAKRGQDAALCGRSTSPRSTSSRDRESRSAQMWSTCSTISTRSATARAWA